MNQHFTFYLEKHSKHVSFTVNFTEKYINQATCALNTDPYKI